MTVDWTYIQENWDWAGHMLEALAIAGVVSLLSRLFLPWRTALVIGLAFASGHFHGREKRDYEVSVHMQPPHLEGYYFWRWDWDQTTDFWPTALLCLALIVIVIRWQRRPPPPSAVPPPHSP